MLAMHPESQDKVFDELQSLFPDQKSDVTSAELNQLQYTNQVIKETLRLYPAVPYMTRMSQKDIAVGKYLLLFKLRDIFLIKSFKRFKMMW